MNSAKKTISFWGLYLLSFILIPLVFGFLSLYLGRDVNWDLKNYHYYNAYSFLNGRMDYDIAPAQLQTYINPLSDLPFYWLTQNFPSWVAGFVLGLIHGYNLSLVFLIFWKLSRIQDVKLKIVVGGSLIAVSGIAPGFLSELGNTMNDNLTSVFVLCALLLLMYSLDGFEDERLRKRSALYAVAAGFIMGFGVGLKPSITIFAISTALIFAMFQRTWQNKLVSILMYGFSGALGGLVSAGYWWVELWQRFENPFFPFYNHIFKSPYFTSNLVVWSTFLPKTFWDYVFWPFIFSLDGYRVNQIQFSDIRFLLFYIVVIMWGMFYVFKKLRLMAVQDVDFNKYEFDFKSGTFLLSFFFLSYVLWIRESATYRFLIPLELLLPLCYLILIERFIPSPCHRQIIVLASVVLTFLVFRPFHWGRLEWDDAYFEVDTSELATDGKPIVIMLGSSPTSYVIPHFPPEYRFVRYEGNLFYGANGKQRNSYFIVEVENLFRTGEENFYVLYNQEEDIDLSRSFQKSGFDIEVEYCFLLRVNTPDKLQMCKIQMSARPDG